ncbi:MAG: hypothetical protein K2U26_15060 [Cyclobacteriaceae bacterium]|nr:hypothetical protein [Cyclobacteriaceae bacterium]
MPEVIIKYKDNKALKVLEAIADYLDISISQRQVARTTSSINGVPVLESDKSIDVSSLGKIFTGRKINARELRTKSWQRRK